MIAHGTRKWIPLHVGRGKDPYDRAGERTGALRIDSAGNYGAPARQGEDWTPPDGWHVAHVVGCGDGFALVELVKIAEPYRETVPCEPALEAYLKELRHGYVNAGMTSAMADAEIALRRKNYATCNVPGCQRAECVASRKAPETDR